MGYSSQYFYNREAMDISPIIMDQGGMDAKKFADTLRFWMAKKGSQQEELAEACDISQPYVSMLLGGKKNPSIGLINKLTEYFQVDISDFFKQATCSLDDFTLIPKLAARPRGGVGGLETDAEFTGWYSFKTEFLNRKGHPYAMYLFEVVGDSMEKTLFERDMILVDTSQSEPVTGKIFLVRVNDEFMVKRIEKRPGVIKLISDNKTYDPIEINSSMNDDVEIYGKMIWSCREYS